MDSRNSLAVILYFLSLPLKYRHMKAISLISGGLDSILATKLILDQGIDVVALTCVTPFNKCNHKENCNCAIRKVTNKLGVELRVLDISQDFLSILTNPSYGFGSNMNPCIDCKILIFKKAKELMPEIGAKFLVSGEVVGQRPMSQQRPILNAIEKKAGVKGILIRPLSAKLLKPTEPEKNGWVDREKLLGISGRGRKDQFALAEEFDISDFSTPAGGCFLTYKGYSRKIKDLIKYNELTLNNVNILKVGRHFRISPKLKLIVGRDERDNQKLLDISQERDLIFEPVDEIRGPVALGRGEVQDKEQIEQCSRIIGRYCDKDYTNLVIKIKKVSTKNEERISCLPFEDRELDKFRI